MRRISNTLLVKGQVSSRVRSSHVGQRNLLQAPHMRSSRSHGCNVADWERHSTKCSLSSQLSTGILFPLLLLFMYYVETREAPIIAWCNLEAPKRLGRGSRNNTMEFVPKDAILVGGLLWCPNAKVGTSTMYYILKKNFGEFEHQDSWKKEEDVTVIVHFLPGNS